MKFDEKSNTENKSRSLGIQKINLSKGYYTQGDTGKISVPKPIHIHTIGPMIKENRTSTMIMTSPLNTFDKGEELLMDFNPD